MSDENDHLYKIMKKHVDRKAKQTDKSKKEILAEMLSQDRKIIKKEGGSKTIKSKISKQDLLELFQLIEKLPLDETDKEQKEFETYIESGKNHTVEAISETDLVFINKNAPIAGIWTGKSDITNTVFGETPRYYFDLNDNKLGELLCKSRVFRDVTQKLPVGQEVMIFKANNGRWALKPLDL